jgi:EpsI family protein
MQGLQHLLLPRSTADRVAWGCVAAGALVLVAALARFWGANPGHADRFLILVGAAWAAYRLMPTLGRLPVRPRPVLGLPLLVIGATAFPVGVFLLVQIGPRTLLLWWLALALVAAAGGLVLARLGWPRLRVMLFPLLFPLFALPIPLRVLNPVQDVLQDVTTTLGMHGLQLAGLTVTREEFILALPGGKLRVEEACSGVRSVTARTAIAAFVAFLRGFGPVRGALLVGLTVPVVAAVNVLRVILSGLIQEEFGPAYIQGDWHEALGLAMVLVGLVLVLGMARVLAVRSEETAPPVPDGPGGEPGAGWRTAVPAGLLVLGAVVTVGFALAGRTAEERGAESAPLGEVATTLGEWKGESRPIPPAVTDLLAPDVELHRVYRNTPGTDVAVWAFYWGTGAAIRGYHHPDVCWGNKGYEVVGRWVEPVRAGEATLPVTAREFRHGRERSIVLYWTQEGRRVWTAEDERAALSDMLTSSWSGHRWVGDLLGAPARETGPRLTVVLVAPASEYTSGRNRREVAALSGLVAAEIYRVCPWAVPRE